MLVFALAQGLFWIGVASTFVMGLGTAITVGAVATIAVGARGFAGQIAKAKPGTGLIIVRGLETAAAFAIILFGAALLTGYMVSERMGMFRRAPARWAPQARAFSEATRCTAPATNRSCLPILRLL